MRNCNAMCSMMRREYWLGQIVRAIGRTGKVKGGRQFDDEFNTPVFLTAENLKPFFPQ